MEFGRTTRYVGTVAEIILVLAGSLLVLGLAVMMIAIVTAPEGHEDRTSFHFGRPPVDQRPRAGRLRSGK
jgi:hypothetical protein